MSTLCSARVLGSACRGQSFQQFAKGEAGKKLCRGFGSKQYPSFQSSRLLSTKRILKGERTIARDGRVHSQITGEVGPRVTDGAPRNLKNGTDDELKLACPICYSPLSSPDTFMRTCDKCQRSYFSQGDIFDLTIGGDSPTFEAPEQAGTFIFQNPLVAFVYERGWRQGFAAAGFPGVDEEFRIAQRYLSPAQGGSLLDVSCGSGLFSRRFATCRDYSSVVASDYSTPMLQQCKEFLAGTPLPQPLLVRADVARLPFETASLAGVHAGAAIHCWPRPDAAVAEISRVLKPGGVFVASTFLRPPPPFGLEILNPLSRVVLSSPFDPYRWWVREELEDLTKACGLQDFVCDIRSNFIIFSARKRDDDLHRSVQTL